MEPEGLGLLSGFVTALGNLAGVADGTLPPEHFVGQPGGAVIELRVSGAEYEIAPEHILAVLSGANQMTGQPQLELTLDALASSRFAEITTTHQGQTMELAVCDRVLMAPVIQEPITSGQIVIAGNFTQDEVARYANHIAGGVPCDPPAEMK